MENDFRTETLVMPQVKCKNCGKILNEPFLHTFDFTYNESHYRGKWCLCEECLEKGVVDINFFNPTKRFMRSDMVEFLKGLAETISCYALNRCKDVFYADDYYDKNIFLRRVFEYGGTVGNLIENRGNYTGIYLVTLPENFGKVEFLEHSKLKIWRPNSKHKDPTVSIETLREHWVEDTNILYIGRRVTKPVRKRMIEHFKFWNADDENAPGRGGRIIGQIKNWENLEVWYLKCENPIEMEKSLIKEFKERYNKRPFANLRD